MYVGRDFDPIEPGESDTFSIEFTSDLPPGVSASNPVFACEIAATDDGATVDASPSTRLQSSAGITTETDPATAKVRTFCNVKAGSMIDGNYYLLAATITKSDGSGTVTLYSRVRCKARR